MMNYTSPSISEALLIAVVGIVVVFLVLVVLMAIIWLMGKTLGAKASVSAPAPVSVSVSVPVPAAPAGLVLENVSEIEAALVMAIVADKLEKDPAELNFISIKEVK